MREPWKGDRLAMEGWSLGRVRIPSPSRGERWLRTGANGCAVIRRPVLIVAVVRPFVGIGTRRVLGERGGVVGFGEKPEDGEADSSRRVLTLLVFGYLGEGVA